MLVQSKRVKPVQYMITKSTTGDIITKKFNAFFALFQG